MASLSNTKIKDTYESLVKFSDNGNITIGAKQLTDGFGNNSPFFVSTTQIGIGVTPAVGFDLHVNSNSKIGGNLIVSGNLTVSGTLTYLDVEDLATEDPLIKLARNNAGNTLDIGYFGQYVESGVTKFKGLFNDADDNKFKLFLGTSTEPTTIVNTSGTGYAIGTLVANLEGNVTGGTISGTTGSFSGLVTGIAPTSALNFATKKYVDDSIPDTPALSAVLAIGNTSGANNILMADDQNISFGTDSDLSIYHDGSDSYINDTGTGDLIIDTNKLIIRNNGGNETMFVSTQNAGVELFHNDTKKFETTINGIYVTGSGIFTESLTTIGQLMVSTTTPIFALQNGTGTTKMSVDFLDVQFDSGFAFKTNSTLALTLSNTQTATFASSVTATSFIGPLTGNVTGNVTGNITGGTLSTFEDINIFDDLDFYVSSTDAARQRADARDDDTNFARLHWFGITDDGTTSNFRHAYYDGEAYINVTAASGVLSYTGGATFTGLVTGIAPTADLNFATKKYVDDNLVPAQSLSNVLAIGNTSGSNEIIMADDKAILFGTGSDSFIKHTGSNFVLTNDIGNISFTNRQDDGNIVFVSDDGSGGIVEYFRVDGGDSRVIFGRSIQMADNVSVYFGNTVADDGFIKWDSTADQLFISGESKFLNDLNVIGEITIADDSTISTLELQDTSTHYGKLHYMHSDFTTSGTNIADSLLLVASNQSTGGIVIRADKASSEIVFAIGDSSASNIVMKITDGSNGVEFFPTSTSEGGHIALRSDTDGSYRYAIDNFNDSLRIIRQDDADSANGSIIAVFDEDTDLTLQRDLIVNRTGYFKNNGSSRVLYLDQTATNTGGIVQFRDESNANTWEVVGRNNQFYIYNNGLNKFSLNVNPTNNFIGINGNSTPKAFLHITDGTNSYPTDANNKLVVESTGHTYIGLGGGDASDVGIHFGDSTAVDRGRLAYIHSEDAMKISTNGAVRFIIDSSGNATFIGSINITGDTTRGLNITTSGTQDTIKIDRAANDDNAITKYQTASADKWIVGLRNTGDDNFRFYSYGTNSDVLTINQATGNATFLGNVDLHDETSPTLSIKDTTNNVNLLLYSQNADSHIGTYSNHNLKIDTNSTLALTIDTSQNATFASEITVGDDINASTKIVIGESALPELRLKKTDVGTATVSFYSANSQKAFIQLDASENIAYFGASGVGQYFYAGGVLNETKIGANSTFAGNVGIGITPNASFSGVEVLQLGLGMTIFGNTNNDRATMAANLYLDSGTAFRYVMNGYAGRFAIEDGNMLWGVSGSGSAGAVATVNTKMTLLNNGNLGIGTTSPGAKLHIASSTNADGILLTGDGSGSGMGTDQGRSIDFQYTKTDSSFGSAIRFNIPNDTVHGGALTFHTDNTVGTLQQAMVINQAQNVGIGVTSPGSRLSIGGTTGSYTSGIGFQPTGTGARIYRTFIGTDGSFRFDDVTAGFVTRLTINSSGNVGIGNTTPNNKLSVQVGTDSRMEFWGNTQYAAMQSVNDTNTTLKPMRFDASAYYFIGGSVGIGTDSPNAKLDVDANSATLTKEILKVKGGGSGGGFGFLVEANNGDNIFKVDTLSYNSYFTNGKVGIGTTNPNDLLNIHSASASGNIGIKLTRGAQTHGFRIGVNNNHVFLWTTEAQQMAFATSDVQRLTIQPGGNVGVGTTTPSSQFVVAASNNGKGIETQVTTHASNNQFILAYDRANSAYLNMEISALNFGIATNNGTNRFRITTQGNVGINTTNPSAKLDVREDANNKYTAYFYNSDTNTNSHGINVQTASTHATAYAFRVNSASNANALTVMGNGNVGINTVAGSSELTVNGTAYISNAATVVSNGSSRVLYLKQNAVSAGNIIQFQNHVSSNTWEVVGRDIQFYIYNNMNGQGFAFYINPTNNYIAINKSAASYNLDVNGTIRATSDVIAFSDRRVKENIVTIDSALDKITKLRGVTYTRKDTEDKSTKVGVIAQEVLEVLPEVVEKDDEGMYSVAYGNMAGVFIEAIKELKAEVDSLKEEIKQLKK